MLHTRNHPRGVSRFGCSWLLPVLVACTCCAFNLTKYSYHFGLFRLWEVFLAHSTAHLTYVKRHAQLGSKKNQFRDLLFKQALHKICSDVNNRTRANPDRMLIISFTIKRFRRLPITTLIATPNFFGPAKYAGKRTNKQSLITANMHEC